MVRIVDIFAWIETSGVAVQKIHENNKKWQLCEELLSKNDLETVLATFCCYDYGANASEAVQKKATDQKDYHKSSSCVIVFSIIAKIYQSVKQWKKIGYLLTRTPPA